MDALKRGDLLRLLEEQFYGMSDKEQLALIDAAREIKARRASSSLLAQPGPSAPPVRQE